MSTLHPVEVFEDSDAPCIIVAFGGILHGIDMPPFEFMSVLRGVRAAKVFVRDIHQCYYQAGLPGISTDIPGTVTYLDGLIADKYSIFVGHSMGGFAALLFGSLCNASKIVSFSPQLFIDEDLIDKYDTRKWNKYAVKGRGFKGEYTNVIPIIPEHAEIYFGKGESEDVKYVTALRDHGIEPRFVDKAVHHTAKILRDKGKLLSAIVPNDYCK